MALAEGQFSVRSLVMGPGTAYDVGKTTNPFTLNVRANQSDERAWAHGSWSGAEWGEQRSVPLRIVVRGQGTAGWLAAYQALMAAFAPVGDVTEDVELRFTLGGTEYLLFGRPRMVEPNVENIATGASGTRAAFVATDPLIYSGALLATDPIPLPVQAGGLLVPFTVPFTIGGTLLGGSEELTNDGTAPSPITLRINGPVEQPFVSLQRPDGVVQTLRFDLDLPENQHLIVSTGARTAFLNGLPQASRRGSVTAEPDWPILQGRAIDPNTGQLEPPTVHQLRFGAAEHNDQATLLAEHRSAWW